MEDQSKNTIEELNKKLYSRDLRVPMKEKRHELRDGYFMKSGGWAEENKTEEGMTKTKKSSIFKKFFIFSLLFFIGAMSFGLYMFIKGTNVVSTENINISILGPVSIAGGEELVLDIIVENNNPSSLELADLIVEYSEGAKKVGEITTDLPRERFSLGEIKAGESIRRRAKSVFFGEENSKKNILVTVEYKIKDSNALVYKTKTYELTLNSSPITVNIKSFKEVKSGQDMEIVVEVKSNSSAVLKNLLFRAEYPFGFLFKDSTPKQNFDNNVWSIGDLKPQGVRTIKIRGTVEGQEFEERVFKFYIGAESAKDEKLMGTIFLSSSRSVLIRKSFIGAELFLDGSSSREFVTKTGRTIKAEIEWENNLPTQIKDVEIYAKLNGTILKKTAVTVEKGFYRSSDNTIIWDKSTEDDFVSVNPGDHGRVSFSFSTILILDSKGLPIKNPEMSIDIGIKGKRVSESKIPEEITSAIKTSVKVASDLNLTSRLLFYSGPFTNIGILPPKADTPVSYTAIWSITNSSNIVSGVKVSASLPSYVSWLGVVDPSNEKVSFDSNTRMVTWDVGAIMPNTGISASPREASFQVSFLPSVSQIGTSPVIVSEPTIEGYDTFSQIQISSIKNALTTNLLNDSGFSTGQGVVVK